MKKLKTLLFCLCVIFGFTVFAGVGALANNGAVADTNTTISVKGATFWDTNATGSDDFYYIFVEFTGVCNGSQTPDPNTLNDNFYINGKTMAEHNAYQSGFVTIMAWNNSNDTKLWLKVSTLNSDGYGLKRDGNDLIELKTGTIVRNGAVVSEDYKARLDGSSFKRIGVATTVTEISLYDTNLTGSPDYVYIFVAFDGTPFGVDPTDPHTFMDDMTINGSSLNELNAVKSGSATVMSWEQGGTARNKLMLKVLTNIADGYGLKRDGTDIVSVKQGAVVRNGNFVTEEYSALLYGSTFYKYYPQTTTRINFKEASIYYNVQSGWDWLYLIFDGTVSDDIAVTILTANILTDIKINGQTVGEYNSTATSKINAAWAETTGNQSKLRLMIPSTLTIERLQIAKGFTTINGKTLGAEVDRYHYTDNGMDKFIAFATPNGNTTAIESMSMYPNQDVDNDWLFINFTEDIVTAHSYDFTKYVYDYIKINDKTIGEINALDPDAIRVEFPTGTNKKQLLLRVRMDATDGFNSIGTHKIEVLSGFTGLNGVSTTETVKKLYYNKNGISSILPYVEPSGQKVEFSYMSMYLNQDNGSNHFVYLNFNGEIADKTSRGVNNEYFYDYITVNGKTIAEILKLTPGLISVEYPTKTQMLLRIYTSKLEFDQVFKFDGTDVYTVKSGFTGTNGASVDKDYSFVYYNKNGMNKFMPYTSPTGQTVNVTSLEIYPKNPNDTWDSLYIIFDGVVGEVWGTTETTYIYDYIKVNGKTLGELKAQGNAMSILWNPNSTKKLLVYVKTGLETSFRYDGTDRVEVLSGMVMQNGATIENGCDKIYHNAKFVDTVSLADTQSIAESYDDGENINLKIKFLLAKMADGATPDLTKLLFNGVALSDIAEGVTATWKIVDGLVLLDISLAKTLFDEQSNLLTVQSGFEICHGIYTIDDIDLLYDSDYVYWISDGGFVFPNEEIKVTSIGAPRILPDGNFAVPVTFNKPLTNTRLQDFTADFTTLLKKSNDGEIGYYYDAELISYLVLTDLPHRALKYIKVNGYTLEQFGAEHVSVNMNGTEIMIIISKNATHPVTDLNTNVTVEIESGVHSLLGGNVVTDTLYTYDYSQKIWVAGEYVTPAPESPKSSGCSGDINGTLIALIALPLILVFRRRKNA